ncbi:MAG: molybdopterin molybdenumtransferase MoeA, partial [Gammaproteobacteria bacterium HGW-Gammaproteobacteria-7]
QRLGPAHLGLGAALGLDRLAVMPRTRGAVFSSGDELRAAGQPLSAGEIYDSNGPMLAALLASEGITADRGPVLPDDPEAMLERLRESASGHDLLITCGGVSAGEKDHLPALLQRHGRVHFWRVRIKPGMPVLLGELDGTLILGLPGNPVAVMACFLVLGRRLIDRLEGAANDRPRQFARLGQRIEKHHPRLEFMRGTLRSDPDGVLRVTPDSVTGSHRLAAASAANALIVVPEGPCDLAADTVVAVLPFGAMAE